MNFEDNSAISFVVLATDLSISDTRTGTTTVSVMVSDTNENPPVFSTTFSGSVMEDAVISTFVLQVNFWYQLCELFNLVTANIPVREVVSQL